MQLLSILKYDKLSEATENIGLKMLALTRYQAFSWPELRRSDFLALSSVTGSWRDRDSVDLKCKECSTPLDTLKLMIGECTHITPAQYGKRAVTIENLPQMFKSIKKIRLIGYHMFRTIKANVVSGEIND